MIRTGTRSLEEVDGAEEDPTAMAVAIAVKVAETTWSKNIHLKEKMKDGPIFILTITKPGHRPSQFKKISDNLPVLCEDKNYQGLDKVFRTGLDPVKTNFMLDYPDSNLWSTTYHVQVSTANPDNNANDVTVERPICYQMMEQTHVTEANLQKELLS